MRPENQVTDPSVVQAAGASEDVNGCVCMYIVNLGRVGVTVSTDV